MNTVQDSTPITTAWLVGLGFTKYAKSDWLQIETLPGIYLAWDGEGLRLESVMIPGPQTRQRVYDIFAALGLEPPCDETLNEAWLLSRGGQRTMHGVSIELSPSLFMTWNDKQTLWIGGISIPGPHTKDRVLAIMAAIGSSQPIPFHSYYDKAGELWSCIGISKPVMVLPGTRLYMARLSHSDEIGVFSPSELSGDPLVHADSVWSGTLVILRYDGEVYAWPLEKFKKDFVLKGRE